MLELGNRVILLAVVETVAVEVEAELMSALVVVEGVLEAMVVKLTNLVHCQLLHHNQIPNHAAKVFRVAKKISILNSHLLEFEFK